MISTQSPTSVLAITGGTCRTAEVHAAVTAFKRDAESLAPVLRRLVERDGFSAEKAEAAQEEFLKFFSILKVEGGPLSPSSLCDEFWHAFILHTKTYADWCSRHLGRFVHHVPYLGSTVNEQTQKKTRCRSTHLLRKHFPESSVVPGDCRSCHECHGCGASNCGAA